MDLIKITSLSVLISLSQVSFAAFITEDQSYRTEQGWGPSDIHTYDWSYLEPVDSVTSGNNTINVGGVVYSAEYFGYSDISRNRLCHR